MSTIKFITASLAVALAAIALAACTTDTPEDLGELGDGKADNSTISDLESVLTPGQTRTFTFVASTAVYVSAGGGDLYGRLLLSLRQPNGQTLSVPEHPTPYLIAPRPDAPGTYTLTVKNTGTNKLTTSIWIVAKVDSCDGGDAPNACGGCGELVQAPGTACACGGGVARCTYAGTVSCTPPPQMLAPQTDAVDEWREIKSAVDARQGLPLGLDSQHSVGVDDTFWGVLQPEIEYHHPGGFTASVCVTARDWLKFTEPMSCLDGPVELSSSGCCKEVGPGETTVSLAVRLLPLSPLDEDYTWDITVNPLETSGASCAPYSIRYRF